MIAWNVCARAKHLYAIQKSQSLRGRTKQLFVFIITIENRLLRRSPVRPGVLYARVVQMPAVIPIAPCAALTGQQFQPQNHLWRVTDLFESLLDCHQDEQKSFRSIGIQNYRDAILQEPGKMARKVFGDCLRYCNHLTTL
jgi:hypothetical protein